MNIRARLTILFSVLCSALLLLSFGVIYKASQTFLEEEYEKRLTDKALTTAVLLLKVDQVDSALLKTIDRAKEDNLHLENISIFNKENREIYTNNDSIQFFSVNARIGEIREKKRMTFHEDGFDIVGFRYTHKNEDFVVTAGAVDIQRKIKLKELRALLFYLFFILVSIVTAAGWLYAGRALKPINKIIKQVDGLSTTDLSQRLSMPQVHDEIGKLVLIFNRLLARIENAFTLQKTFVANVSHELKNPLTKITSQLEVTSLKERSPSEYQQIIRSVLEDVKELNHLSTSLLDLATISEDPRSFTMSRVRIDEIIWEAREKILAVHQDYEVEFSIAKMPDDENQLIVKGNPYLLRTALVNLIENACKFSFDQKAAVALLCSATEIAIRIINNGPGIPSESSEKVFQPFYRSDNTSRVKGYGIGLPLTEKIISIHQGILELESIPNETTVFTITLKVD